MNSNIPLFDSLTHPTPNGDWLNPKYHGTNTFEALLKQMRTENVNWCFAVGMGPTVGNYEEETYARLVRSYSENLFPIAFLDFQRLGSVVEIDNYLGKLKSLGYVGIKIHPRLSQITYDHFLMAPLLRRAGSAGLLVLLCSYCYEPNQRCIRNNLEQLQGLLLSVSPTRIIILHGGSVRLLEMAEVIRSCDNLLLDLSYTMCKYEGSSLDLDIKFLFRRFDQRICVGSDNPEFSLAELRRRFNFFSEGVPEEKLIRIAHGNLLDFLKLKPDAIL